MSDAAMSVVLLLDIFFIIVGVKVLVRLIVMLRQLPPAPRLRPVVSDTRRRSSPDSSPVWPATNLAIPVPHRPR